MPTRKSQQTTLYEHFESSSSPLRPHSTSRRTSAPTSPRKRRAPPSDGSASDSSADLRDIQFETEQLIQHQTPTEAELRQHGAANVKSQLSTSSHRQKKPRMSSPSPSSSAHADELEAGDSDDLSPVKKRQRKPRAIVVTDSEDDGEDDHHMPTCRLDRDEIPQTDSVDEDNDLEQDNVLPTRFRDRHKQSRFSLALEKMKSRRRHESVTSDANSENSPAPIEGAYPTDAGPIVDEDAEVDSSVSEQDSDFVVEDDEGADVPELPAAFSMQAHQDLSHHFKVIFQLFVHLTLSPRHKRRNFMNEAVKSDYFALPLQVARRKLSGIQDSVVTSSVWRPEFKKMLSRYPEFCLHKLGFAVPHCDACHLGARISTLEGRLSGQPYDRLTYKPIDEDGQDGAEDNVSKTFSLGRFCARRTQVFHDFAHWEHNLFSFLAERVASLSVSRSSSRSPDEIIEDLDGRGVLQEAWKQVKDMMESATKLDIAGKEDGED